jgi:RNA polymerase sigma-70 factor (ECF subfamily)
LSVTGNTGEVVVSDDDRLMRQVKTGSVEAFEELYDRYCDRAYQVARSVCHDPSRAEDAVQEAFISLWNGRSKYLSQRGTVAAWLLTAVRYRAIDVSRRDRKHSDRRAPEQAIDRHAALESIADRVATREEVHRLRVLLTQLPEAQREVITLAFYGELSHTEIATALDLPTGTVKGRMRLGLQKLRTNIEKEAA